MIDAETMTESMANLWVKKSIADLKAEAADTSGHGLKRTLTGTNLILLGIGAIIGAGFFGLTGEAAAKYRWARDSALVRARRRRLCICRAVLRRDGLDRAGGGLSLHVRVCHDGRVHRLADRLGPDPRVHGRGDHRGDQLVRLRRQFPPRPRDRPAGKVPGLARHGDDPGARPDRQRAAPPARVVDARVACAERSRRRSTISARIHSLLPSSTCRPCSSWRW